MIITECQIPSGSVLNRKLVETAYFWDAYRAPQHHFRSNIVDSFFSVFGHLPGWLKAVLILRNTVAKWCGLETPTTSEILGTHRKTAYAVGDKIGPWPIFSLTETELVAGRDNKHLDFRLSLMRVSHLGAACLVVSTVCRVHNRAGKIYLFFIVPIHKWGVKLLISRAIKSGRL